MEKDSGQEKGMVRVAENDPNRCQSDNKFGQCYFRAMEGTVYCKIHGGGVATKALNRKAVSGYRLAQWEVRVNELANDDGIKSLRDEIGILRMTLEALVTKCNDQTDLMLYAPRISDMVMKIERIVTSCNKLETSTGMLLDKAAALVLAGKMVEIISCYVTDPAAVDAIANEIGMAITSIGKIEEGE